MSAAKKQRLGRGLGALLSESKAQHADGGGREQVRQLAPDQLQRGRYQPRTHMDDAALEDLAQSIRAQGVIQPILVRPLAEGYEIIAGERRWRAAQRAGLEQVPVIVRDISDESVVAVSLIENIQRESLNALEEARALKRLLEEFRLTHEQAAQAVGRSRTAVTNNLRLLSLSAAAGKLIESGALDAGHGRALLSLPAAQQAQAARTVARKGLTVRATEALVKRMLQNKTNNTGAGTDTNNPDIARLQDEVSRKLGAPVQIRHGAKKGRLIIEYHSLEELDGILDHIH